MKPPRMPSWRCLLRVKRTMAPSRHGSQKQKRHSDKKDCSHQGLLDKRPRTGSLPASDLSWLQPRLLASSAQMLATRGMRQAVKRLGELGVAGGWRSFDGWEMQQSRSATCAQSRTGLVLATCLETKLAANESQLWGPVQARRTWKHNSHALEMGMPYPMKC